MAYLSSEIRDDMINRINNCISINKISKELNLAKSIIYYHYKKIKGKKFKDVEFNFNKEDELGEFLGIFAGDGNFFHDKNGSYNIRIFVGYYEKEYAYILENLFFNVFNKKPWIWTNKSVIILQYKSKKLYKLLREHLNWIGKKTYSVGLINLNHSKLFFTGFLRGLLDTDGSYNKSRNTIMFSTTSKNLDLQTAFILEKILNIRFGKYIYYQEGRKPLYQTLIYGENARSIIEILKPRNKSKRPLTNNL